MGVGRSELNLRELAAVRKARDEAPSQLGALLSDQEIAALVRRADCCSLAGGCRGRVVVAFDPVAAVRPGHRTRRARIG